MKWIYRILSLWYGCRHRWEVVGERIQEYAGGFERKMPMSQCKRCGALKLGYS